METLVLSASYEPVARVPWQRAVTLVWDGKVEVVASYEDRFVHSPSVTLAMPAVVRFLARIRIGRRRVRFSRGNVWVRDRGQCQYCLVPVSRHAFTFDHVVPRAKGGPTSWENIVTCCRACNMRKSHRSPTEVGLVLRSAPRRPNKLDFGRFRFTADRGLPASWHPFLGVEAREETA